MAKGYMQTVGKTTEWRTPMALFQKLNQEFHFTLDPASTAENALCEKYYTAQEDGLIQSWAGERVFCNPPYGKIAIANWVQKAYAESEKAEVIVMLIPSRTDSKWFHDYVLGKAEIRFIRGRLKFGGAEYNAPFANMLVIWRPKTAGYIV